MGFLFLAEILLPDHFCWNMFLLGPMLIFQWLFHVPPHHPISSISFQRPAATVVVKVDPAVETEGRFGEASESFNRYLSGGFKYFVFSPLSGEDSHFD